MLGYMTDKKDYFKGNLYEFYLKKAISFSGGSTKHYNFFKGILNYSIINRSTKNPLHDAKAGQFAIHLFPLNIKALLSIIFYNYEKRLLEEFKDYPLYINNILLPSEQIKYSNFINNNKTSFELNNILDDVILNNQNIEIILEYFNIKNKYLNINDKILDNVENVLAFNNINNNFISNYLEIVKNNNRLESILLAAKTLNYKPQSIQYLTEAIILWQQNLNI